MAQTLLSTSPPGIATCRTTSSVTSVPIPDARLGHAIQRPPAGKIIFGEVRDLSFEVRLPGEERDDDVGQATCLVLDHDARGDVGEHSGRGMQQGERPALDHAELRQQGCAAVSAHLVPDPGAGNLPAAATYGPAVVHPIRVASTGRNHRPKICAFQGL